jgi:hypothetical protein
MAIDSNVENVDEFIQVIATASDSLDKEVDQHQDVAVLVLGVKYYDGAEPDEEQGCQTYIMSAGKSGVLAEGLYAELADQIEHKQLTLFNIIREVIRDLEADFEIAAVDTLQQEKDDRILH